VRKFAQFGHPVNDIPTHEVSFPFKKLPTYICTNRNDAVGDVAKVRKLSTKIAVHQGCQMVYFKTKNPELGKFWRALDWKNDIFYCHLEYFTDIWDIL
jgi:hypothetical protein